MAVSVQNTDLVENILTEVKKFEHFVAVKCTFESKSCVIITHKQLYSHPPLGMMSRFRLSVTFAGEYTVHILMRFMEQGLLSDPVIPAIEGLLRKYSPFSATHKFCPGLALSEYENYKSVIRFHCKGVRETVEPISRVDSVGCLMWFEIGKVKVSKERREAEELLCPNCVRMKSNLDHQVRRTVAESPSKKIKRQCPSSRARLSYMSPQSQMKRKQNTKTERDLSARKLYKYEHTEIPLDSEQDSEMSEVMSTIDHQFSDELQQLISEGEKHGVGDKMREIWKSDKRSCDEEFKKDQDSNRTGKRSNKWSFITIRMALAVYSRSPAAYDALKSFKVLQLPSKSTLQAYTGVFIHEPGANHQSIADQVSQFIVHNEERKKAGLMDSKKAGALIFDEVKVIGRLMWNSRNQKIIGLSMNRTDMAALEDVYQSLSDTKLQQTNYILQFLWRDLTGEFDIVGPYFTCSQSMKSKYIYSCVMETVKLFHLHGLKTILLVCDGASANLSMIKATHGHSGVYPIDNKDEADPLKVNAVFTNPFDPPNVIHWMICPTHQLKNMINSLFSSRIGGTKAFELNEFTFGWSAITDLYKRECIRVNNGLTRMVPKLREVYVLRDAWTKLNVTPAKIMQQEHVLSELHDFITNHPEDSTISSTRNTLKYLEACSQLFENGFLSHDRVSNMSSDVLKSIQQGYLFFVNWLQEIQAKDANFNYSNSTQRKFMAWQTFDLLRIDVYGFESFAKYFFQKYPGHFLSPLRISGSAVETLFGQYKYNAGGKLDAVNYSTARAASLVRQTVSGHHSGKDYKDKELSTPQLPLKRKEYGKSKKA